MIRKIEYQNKQGIIDPSVPQSNQVTDGDMNEIKSVVNNNADEQKNTTETLVATFEGISDRLDGHDTSISEINDDISNIEGEIDNVYTKTETDELLDAKATTIALGEETSARENADVDLQHQIDSIVASSDVVDIVGTYTDLQNYDTSKLGDNDIIKVLNDSTHNNAVSYYRWKKTTSTWQYIGSEGPYYTKGQTDGLLNEKVDKVQGKGLSENDFTDTLKTKLDNIESGAQVNKIESIKLNGVVQTIVNKIVDIIAYVKPSGGIPKTDLSSDVQTSLGKADTSLQSSDISSSITSSSTNSQVAGAKAVYDYVGSVVGDIDSALDLINGEVIS